MSTTLMRDSLGEFAGAWDSLVEAAPLPSPFLRSWWLERVARVQPCFVLVVQGDELLGGLALEQDTHLGVCRVRPLGVALTADHVDLVARPERLDDVVDGIQDGFRQLDARVIDLIGCHEDARVARALPDAGRHEIDVAPWEPLPASYEDYLATRTSSLKSQIDRPARRLQREGAVHRVIPPEESERALEVLRRLHEQVFGGGSQFLPFFDRFAAAAPSGMAKGELVMHEFTAEGRTVALNVCFQVAGRLSYYQSGRDTDERWRGAGMTLVARAIEHAIEAGCRELDMLRGGEGYKRAFAGNERSVLRIETTRGLRGRVAAGVITAVRRLRKSLGPKPG